MKRSCELASPLQCDLGTEKNSICVNFGFADLPIGWVADLELLLHFYSSCKVKAMNETVTFDWGAARPWFAEALQK